MKKCAILLNGELTVTNRLLGQIAGADVVAADGGMRHAQVLEVEPMLWVGDFDSSDEFLKNQWQDVPCQAHPYQKDQTDGELAIKHAIDNGVAEIILVAGLGGQTDQTVSHLLQMIKLARTGVNVFATTGQEEAWPLLPGQTPLDLPQDSTFSIVGMSNMKGLSIAGVEWELEQSDVALGSTLTMSNKVTGQVSIDLLEGYGVVFVKSV